MAEKIYIKLVTDPDGFWGGTEPANDHEADAVSRYHAMVKYAIWEVYPGAVIETEYEPVTCGNSIEVLFLGYRHDIEREEEIKDCVSAILDQVWNEGAFWE